MIVWLDHLIFGNGHGLGSPYCDDKFYWLKDKQTERSEFYHWFGGLGAQLTSFQWTHPKPGERRTLRGIDFVPYQSTRQSIRVTVSWRMAGMPSRDLDEEHAMIAALKHALDNESLYMPPEPLHVLMERQRGQGKKANA